MTQFTLTLTDELAEKIRFKAAAEGYGNESSFLEEHLADAMETDSMLEQWLKNVGVARYDAYDAEPKNVYTSEEVMSYLDGRRGRSERTG